MLIARRSRQRGRLPLVDAHLHLLEPHVYLADWHAGLFGTRARLRWRRVRSPRSGSRMACRRTWLRARLYHLFMPSPHLPEAHVCVADRHARLFLARSRLRRRCARPPSSNTAMAWRRKSFRARLNTFSRPLPGLSQRVSRISRWWSGRDRRMVVLESPSTRIWKARDAGRPKAGVPPQRHAAPNLRRGPHRSGAIPFRDRRSRVTAPQRHSERQDSSARARRERTGEWSGCLRRRT
jgi:hypothetical protein